MVVILNN